jgi:uncharacterized membrane protein
MANVLLKRVGWGLMFVLALLMFLLASRYLTLNPDVYFPQQRAVYLAHTVGIITHILGGMLAIIIGPTQFLPKIITKRYVGLHRWLGRVYLTAVLFGGLSGLYMATLAYGGYLAKLGFGILAILWLVSGTLAYRHIRKKEIQRHRQWMVRNYALTFAAVTLRLWQVLFQIGGLEFEIGYIAVAWISWMPNLVVAEWIVRRIRPGRRSSGNA